MPIVQAVSKALHDAHDALLGVYDIHNSHHQTPFSLLFGPSLLSVYLVLHNLLVHHDMSWIASHIIIYADDIHLRWIIHNTWGMRPYMIWHLSCPRSRPTILE